MTYELSRFFAPLTIHDLTLRNRFVMPAMQRGMMKDGGPSTPLIDLLRKRAEAEVGLIISEGTFVDHPSAVWQSSSGYIKPATADRWGQCFAAVKQAGGAMFAQLMHPGAIRSAPDGSPLPDSLSPSGLISANKANGRAMTGIEMREIVGAFARGASLARELGADGVEIHCAHGYLLDQFLWADTNRRTDGYGGPDMADRARFPAEVVAAVRQVVGPLFPISVRLSQFKEIDYNARVADSPEQLQTLITLLRRAGADLLHMSTRRFYEPAFPGSDRSLAGWAKSFTDAPVIAVGSVGLDNDVFSQMLDNGEARPSIASDMEKLAARMASSEFDLVAVGRGLIADEAWVRKVRTGRTAEITPFTKALLERFIAEWEAGPVEVARGTDMHDGLEKTPDLQV